MDDKAILDLYWSRSEKAISETDAKYGAYCFTIAYNILSNREDSEESVSDSYMAAWNSMPPHRPAVLSSFLGKITRRIAMKRWRYRDALSAFLGKITRYLSLDRWKKRSRLKRGGGETELCLEELQDCVSGQSSTEDALIRKETLAAVNRFVSTLSETERKVFLCRYWYLDSVKDIAERFGLSPNRTSVLLRRVRQKLNACLAKEGLL